MLRQERRSTCPYDPLARGSTFRLSHDWGNQLRVMEQARALSRRSPRLPRRREARGFEPSILHPLAKLLEPVRNEDEPLGLRILAHRPRRSGDVLRDHQTARCSTTAVAHSAWRSRLQPCLHSPCCPPPMLSLVQEQAVIITGIRAGTASDCYACAVGRTMPTED